jgi:hypothetical protein
MPRLSSKHSRSMGKRCRKAIVLFVLQSKGKKFNHFQVRDAFFDRATCRKHRPKNVPTLYEISSFLRDFPHLRRIGHGSNTSYIYDPPDE